MHQLFGGGGELLWVAVKALLLYLTAVFAFRVGRRRTLAEMSPFDFVAAVAVGAIIGRVPNSDNTSYLEGAVTLVTILFLHACITWLRFFPKVSPVFDHSPRILVSDGTVVEKELRRSGLTRNDLFGLLRQHGVTDLQQVAFVIFEQRGKVSVVRSEPSAVKGQLVRDVVDKAGREGRG